MRKIQLSEKVKNVTKISSGSILGQLISIVTLPFITRLYNVEIIGIWTIVTSFANIIQNVSDLGMANTLMICKEKEVSTLFNIIVKITFVLSTISGVVVFLYYLIIGEPIKQAMMLYFMTVIYAFTLKDIAIYGIILNRNKQYDVLMKNPIIRFLSTAIISIGLGMLGVDEGYYIGTIIGQVFTLVHMKKYVPQYERVKEIELYVKAIKEHKEFVKYQLPASITVTLRTEIPNLLIRTFFGNEMLGYFSISQKLLTIPVTFLGQSLGTVFYQSIAEMRAKGEEIGQFVAKNIRRGMIVAFIPMVLLAAYGDAAITIFFGLEYSIGGVICRIIVYRALFNFISMATRGIDIVLNKQQYVFVTTLLQTLFAIISVVLGYYAFHSIYAVAVLLAVTFIVIQIWYFSKMYQIMKIPVKKYIIDAIGLLVLMLLVSLMLRYVFLTVVKIANLEWLNYLLKYFIF